MKAIYEKKNQWAILVLFTDGAKKCGGVVKENN